MKNKIKKDKIELICYCANNFTFEKEDNGYTITKPLKFIPFDLHYTEDEVINMINVLIRGNPRLKIIIEKEK
jgi:hypothetical protein